MGIIASSILAASFTFTPLNCGVFTNDPKSATITIDRKTFEELKSKVDVMWTAHTNRIAMMEARKTEAAKRKSAIEQVRENAKKRKSKLGKASGGVK